MEAKSFCFLWGFVLIWVALDLVEFWANSESGLRIISKVQMLWQPTFVLKKRNILSVSQGIFEQNLV